MVLDFLHYTGPDPQAKRKLMSRHPLYAPEIDKTFHELEDSGEIGKTSTGAWHVRTSLCFMRGCNARSSIDTSFCLEHERGIETMSRLLREEIVDFHINPHDVEMSAQVVTPIDHYY